jgi:hypothetical protein
MSDQRRHESPDVGDAIVRMLRGLVTRASEGDTEAVEQLARIERLAPAATALGGRLAHDRAGYSYTELAGVLGVSRQAARQRAVDTFTEPGAWMLTDHGRDSHQLVPGHSRRTCGLCA